MQRPWCVVVLVAGLALASAAPRAHQEPQGDTHGLFDRILDTYVRDGYVYYKALKSERAALDRYIASRDVAPEQLARMGENDRRAFWINAYNALVLRTVINAYPIHGKAAGYPASSVAQVPGGFDRTRHRVAGRVLTLDEIENTVLAGFGDARVLLALGRGTIGSGRLRSEAYRGSDLEEQLTDVVRDFVTRTRNFRLDRKDSTLHVTPLFSWREAQFVATFGSGGEKWANRSAIERAVVVMSSPHLFPSEQVFLALNTFRMEFGEFDWRLNDLTGGIPQ